MVPCTTPSFALPKITAFLSIRIGYVNIVSSGMIRMPLGSAELRPGLEELAVLIEDLDSLVTAIANKHPTA